MPPAIPHNGHSESRPHFIPIQGSWEIAEGTQTFTGHEKDKPGIAASSALLQNGTCHVTIRFSAPFNAADHQAAGLIVGYRSVGQHFILAALGAAQSAY